MKKMTLRIMTLGLMLGFAFTAIAQSDADVKQKIEKMNKEMAEAVIAGNHEKNLQYYTDDVVSLPSYEKMMQGKDAIKRAMDEMSKSEWKVKDFNFETVSVETNGNLVTEIGKYRMEMTKEGMEQAMKDEGKYLTIWEKQKDGSLKIKTEIWNTDKNPWEEMRAMSDNDHKKMMGDKHDDKDGDMIDKEKKDADHQHNGTDADKTK